MKIINHTEWQTRNLKTFVLQVCERQFIDAKWRNRLNVTFEYRRRSNARPDTHPGGSAYVNSHTMTITLVKNVDPFKWALACVIAHELGHCRGFSGHAEMRTARYSQWHPDSKDFYAWAEALTLERYAPEPKAIPSTAVTKAQAKLANAESLLKQWTSKQKAANNKVSKYKEKVKYYQDRVKYLEANPPELKPKAPRVLSEMTLIRKAINKVISKAIWQRDYKWEVHTMRDDSKQASGLRHPDEEEWAGDYISMRDARRKANPGDCLCCYGYTRDEEMLADQLDIRIPGKEELLKLIENN